ncbi:MAG: hypothetical protein WCW31_03890 [Patescibacteria group bacterium]|jgi:hypothetical protein
MYSDPVVEEFNQCIRRMIRSSIEYFDLARKFLKYVGDLATSEPRNEAECRAQLKRQASKIVAKLTQERRRENLSEALRAFDDSSLSCAEIKNLAIKLMPVVIELGVRPAPSSDQRPSWSSPSSSAPPPNVCS